MRPNPQKRQSPSSPPRRGRCLGTYAVPFPRFSMRQNFTVRWVCTPSSLE